MGCKDGTSTRLAGASAIKRQAVFKINILMQNHASASVVKDVAKMDGFRILLAAIVSQKDALFLFCLAPSAKPSICLLVTASTTASLQMENVLVRKVGMLISVNARVSPILSAVLVTHFTVIIRASASYAYRLPRINAKHSKHGIPPPANARVGSNSANPCQEPVGGCKSPKT